jgi:hypothetical protein
MTEMEVLLDVDFVMKGGKVYKDQCPGMSGQPVALRRK